MCAVINLASLVSGLGPLGPRGNCTQSRSGVAAAGHPDAQIDLCCGSAGLCGPLMLFSVELCRMYVNV